MIESIEKVEIKGNGKENNKKRRREGKRYEKGRRKEEKIIRKRLNEKRRDRT